VTVAGGVAQRHQHGGFAADADTAGVFPPRLSALMAFTLRNDAVSAF
jgi:hypothetical protein